MSVENEKLEDLFAWMREYSHWTTPPFVVFDEDGGIDIDCLIDRLEAAYKREKQAYDRRAEIMRKALERLDVLTLNVLEFPLDGDSSTIYDRNKKEIDLPAWGVAALLNGAKEAQDLARAALADTSDQPKPRYVDRHKG